MQEHRQTARDRIYLLGLIELHHLLLLLLRIGRVALLNLLHLRRQDAQLSHRLLRIVHDGEEDQPHDNGGEQEADCKRISRRKRVAYLRQVIEHPEERPRQRPHDVAPIDRLVEIRDRVGSVMRRAVRPVVLVVLQQIHAFGAGEKPLRVSDALPWRNCVPLAGIARAEIGRRARVIGGAEIGGHRFMLIRDQSRQPVMI